MLLNVENAEYLVERNGGLAQTRIDSAQSLHRAKQAADIAKKCDQGADGDLALEHQNAAAGKPAQPRHGNDKIACGRISEVGGNAANDQIIRTGHILEET